MEGHEQVEPAPTTDAEHQDLVSRAFSLEQSILRNAQAVAHSSWELAHDLYEFHEGGCWSLLGYETLNEFLAQPGLGMKRNQFFRLVRVYRDLVIVRELPLESMQDVNPRTLDEVRGSIMQGKVDAEDAITDARVLGVRDLREKYHPKKEGEEEHSNGSDPVSTVGTDEKPKNAGTDEELDVAPPADDDQVRVECYACGSMVDPESIKETEVVTQDNDALLAKAQEELDRLGAALQRIADKRPPKSRYGQTFELVRKEAREALEASNGS